jgi:hypothetical protein
MSKQKKDRGRRTERLVRATSEAGTKRNRVTRMAKAAEDQGKEGDDF